MAYAAYPNSETYVCSCVYTCIYICIYTHEHSFIYTFANTCVHAYISSSTNMNRRLDFTRYTHIHTYVYDYGVRHCLLEYTTHTHRCFACASGKSLRIQSTHTHTNTRTHTHTHTHIRTLHTHTQVLRLRKRRAIRGPGHWRGGDFCMGLLHDRHSVFDHQIHHGYEKHMRLRYTRHTHMFECVSFTTGALVLTMKWTMGLRHI